MRPLALGRSPQPGKVANDTTCSGSVSSATSSWKGGFSGRLVYRADELRFKRSCFALRLTAQDPSHETVEVGFIFKEPVVKSYFRQRIDGH